MVHMFAPHVSAPFVTLMFPCVMVTRFHLAKPERNVILAASNPFAPISRLPAFKSVHCESCNVHFLRKVYIINNRMHTQASVCESAYLVNRLIVHNESGPCPLTH